ncbi:MAG: PAS domain S-box protein [Armatimonadetes bacterium]|nr:PAS domain S-box protein [Armatimonadota bacterium]
MSVSQQAQPALAVASNSGFDAGVFLLSAGGELISCNTVGTVLLERDADGTLPAVWQRAEALSSARTGLAWSAPWALDGEAFTVCLCTERPGRLLAVVTPNPDAAEPASEPGWLDQAPVMVALLDPQGHIVTANRSLRQRLGQSAETLWGQPFTEVLHEGDRRKFGAVLDALSAMADHEPARPFDVRFVAASHMDVSCALSSLRDSGGACLGNWVVLQDIGDRKQVERDLEAYTHDLEQLYIQLERRTDELQAANEALREARLKTSHAEELTRIEQMKTAFLDVAAHELRTPVTLLTGLLDCLGQEMPAALRDNLMAAAQRSAGRLTSILNTALKLLESGQPDFTGQFRARSLKRLLEDAAGDVRSFSQMRQHTLVVDVSEALPPVTMDVSMMRDVVANLLMNAIKFTPDGGQVTITAGLCEDNDHCWFSVRDNGIGIPEADRPFIFEQFFGTLNTSHHSSGQYEFNTRGPGFGLAVVRKFVAVHRGRIDLVSTPGSGSCFTVTLPIRRKSHHA